MHTIDRDDIARRIQLENPWWTGGHSINQNLRRMRPRAYFELFLPLVQKRDVKRAVVLMGPRRVGKTVLIHHAIQALLDKGVPAASICYFSIDSPIYNGLGLEQLLDHYLSAQAQARRSDELYLFFDEIQYLRKWEEHLKSLIDTWPNIKCVASGSAAAALRLKSSESGAGRFTDFVLPPLTFFEYLMLLEADNLVQTIEPAAEGPIGREFVTRDIEELNARFISYLNFGGYPEVIFSPSIQSDPSRFIKSDIIDKVLLRDLPSLYGIGDIQELNYLFTTLAFNTANEVSLNELSQNSGVAKNTIKRYIDYLEAAFLIKVVHRVDYTAKRFSRANFFKVYLTNPSMRAALFSPVRDDDNAVPYLTETAIFSQWFHSDNSTLHYARWQDGEVDMVMLGGRNQKPAWAVEVKWTDRFCDSPEELKALSRFCSTNGLNNVLVTSKTRKCDVTHSGITFRFVPASLHCYAVGYDIVRGRIHGLTP